MIKCFETTDRSGRSLGVRLASPSIRKGRGTLGLLLAASALASNTLGCGGADADLYADDEAGVLAEATFELKQVPANVTCIRIEVAGASTVAKNFTVAVGASTASLNMDRLPLGSVAINGEGYAGQCNGTPTWIADPEIAELEPGVVSKLDLTFRKNNPATASVNFVGNITRLATGASSTLLIVDGQVYQWGLMNVSAYPTPTLVPNLTNVVDVSGGGGNGFACAVKADGTTWCWGSNTSSVMGSVTSTTTPVQISTSLSFTEIEAGAAHVCALATDGNAYCWGANSEGQLGPSGTVGTNSATPLSLGSAWSLAVGGFHSCVSNSGQQTRCFGSNSFGQLGNGTQTSSPSGVTAAGGNPSIALAGGLYTTMVLLADGTLRATGQNNYGQLGIGSTNTALLLTTLTGLSPVTAVANAGNHGLAIRANGQLMAWGYNNAGQLGDATQTNRTSPISVGLADARMIAVSQSHSCAVTAAQEVYCWGSNSWGQLGDGTRNSSAVPKLIPLLF